MTRILIVEDHVFFSEALELVLGRRIAEESGEVPAFRRAVTVGEGLMLADEEGPFALAIVDLMFPTATARMSCARSRRPAPRRRWPC